MFNSAIKQEIRQDLKIKSQYGKSLLQQFPAAGTSAGKDLSSSVLKAKAALVAGLMGVDTLRQLQRELGESIIALEKEIAMTEHLDVSESERILALRAYQHLNEELLQRDLRYGRVAFDGAQIEIRSSKKLLFELSYNQQAVAMLEVFLAGLTIIDQEACAEKGVLHGRPRDFSDLYRYMEGKFGAVASSLFAGAWRRRIQQVLTYVETLAQSQEWIEAETARAFLKNSRYTRENLNSISLCEKDVQNYEQAYHDMLQLIKDRHKFEQRDLQARCKAVFNRICQLALEAGFKVEFRKHRFVIFIKIDDKKRKFWRWYERSATIKVPYTRKGAVLAHAMLSVALDTVKCNNCAQIASDAFDRLERDLHLVEGDGSDGDNTETNTELNADVATTAVNSSASASVSLKKAE